MELDTAEGHLMSNVQEAPGLWIKVSTRGRKVGFISNEYHRWSSKDEVLFSGTEEKMLFQTHEMVVCCPSSLPRSVTQGYTPGSQGYFIRLILNFSGPSLSCHTCSYMNDQGKCLRGEGVCATQNSQQCMLKKIFEGMWGLHGLVFDRELITQLEYWWGRGWLGWQGPEEGSSWDSLGTFRFKRTSILSRIKSRIPAIEGEALPQRPPIS